MATRQQEIWMALAVAECDGTGADAERLFTLKVRAHRGPFQIPRLSEQQTETCADQALHDTFAHLGFPGTLERLEIFERAVERRQYELEHILRSSLLHPVIQAELWCRRTTGLMLQESA